MYLQHPILDKHNLVKGYEKDKSTQRRLISYDVRFYAHFLLLLLYVWYKYGHHVHEILLLVDGKKRELAVGTNKYVVLVYV